MKERFIFKAETVVQIFLIKKVTRENKVRVYHLGLRKPRLKVESIK